MTRFLRRTYLTLMAGCLGLALSLPVAGATDVETRKGEVIQPPTPSESIDTEMVTLGSIELPAEVIQKLDSKQIAEILERQTSAPKESQAYKIVVPGIVFGSLTLISFMFVYYSFRKRRDMLDTVRIALQSGQTLPASFLEALESKSRPTPDGDLRKAVLLLSLSLSTIGMMASVGFEEAGRAWSIGLAPTFLGIGYLFLWRQSQKRIKTGSNDEPR